MRITLLLLITLCSAESLHTRPLHQVVFRMVEGGPVPGSQAVQLKRSGPWTVEIMSASGDMLTIEDAGKSLIVRLNDWWAASRSVGTYHQLLRVTSLRESSAQLIQVELTVVKRAEPVRFSYLNNYTPECTTSPDYPDAAYCDVPDEKPFGAFTPPAAVGAYRDRTFGAQVRILTHPRSHHGYATPSAISANNRYVLTFLNGNTSVLDFVTGQPVRRAPPVPLEGTIWDTSRPAVLYFLSGPRIYSYNVETNRQTILVDYSRSPYHFSRITNGGTGDGSKDNWLAFVAPEQQTVCAYNLEQRRTYCSGYGQLERNIQVDFPLIAKGVDKQTGKRYVLVMAHPVLLAFSVDEAGGELQFEYRGGELPTSVGNRDGVCEKDEQCISNPHADTMEDESGNQYLVTAIEFSTPCEFSLVAYRLNQAETPGLPIELGGGLTRLTPLFKCGGKDRWADLHIGCAKKAPVCSISIGYGWFNYKYLTLTLTQLKITEHLMEKIII